MVSNILLPHTIPRYESHADKVTLLQTVEDSNIQLNATRPLSEYFSGRKHFAGFTD